jgi:hypothetical protein
VGDAGLLVGVPVALADDESSVAAEVPGEGSSVGVPVAGEGIAVGVPVAGEDIAVGVDEGADPVGLSGLEVSDACGIVVGVGGVGSVGTRDGVRVGTVWRDVSWSGVAQAARLIDPTADTPAMSRTSATLAGVKR